MPNGVVGYMRDDARMGRVVRARARRSAPGAGHPALPPRPAARAHARDARPRLQRRPPLPAGREPGRHRVFGPRRAVVAHASEERRPRALPRRERLAAAARGPQALLGQLGNAHDLSRRRRRRPARSADRARRPSSSTAIASSTCCGKRRRGRPAISTSTCVSTRSSLASSTCTSTASKGPTRSTVATRSRASPRGCRATASRRSARRRSPARPRRCGPCSAAVRAARFDRAAGSSRVLPAHLESNFINPEYRGAQPLECLRLPAGSGDRGRFCRRGDSRRDRGGAARRRDRHHRARARGRDRAHPHAHRARPSRVARAFRRARTSRRSRASTPARGTRRISSIA